MEMIILSSSDEEEDHCYCASDDENDAAFVDGIQDFAATSSSSSSRHSSCQVITKESLLAAQRDDFRRVMDLLLVREHHARTLLIHYQWNVDKLLTVFVEKGKAHLFAEAGATVVENDAFGSSSPSSTFTCDICIEDILSNEATRMDCGHFFCNNCWTEHFIVKIKEGQSKRIRCMAHKCNRICDEGIIRNLVSKRNPDLSEKFDRFLLESYIEDNKMVKWCPSIPHCGNAIRIEEGDALSEVECTCGLQFCFNCLSEAHSPCSCLMWELWSKKCKDESESVKWITVNTKTCPTCSKPVEKNGGCNVVKCICGKYFCWRCGKKFPHNCNQYRPPLKAESTKRELYCYTHYYKRFKGHKDSLKLEAELEQTIKQKVSISEEKEPELQDFSWVKDGVYRLFRSRSILSYSYAFAFHMFGGEFFKDEMTNEERLVKQHLFEDQQQQLEAKVEKLSGLMEEPFHNYTVDKVKNTRLQVILLTGIVDDLCKKMYDFIENDLLGSLRINTHNIVPYESKGVILATDLAVRYTEADSDECVRLHGVMNGCLTEIGQPSNSGSSNESEDPPEKRQRVGETRFHWDLNFPAEPSKD